MNWAAMCDTLIFVNSAKLIHFKVKRYCIITVLFVFLQTILCTAQQKHCPQEFSKVKVNSSQTVRWQSNYINHEIVIPTPPCVDQDQNLVLRTCSDGSWVPQQPPECERVIENSERCPRFFQQTPKGCVYVSKSQPWDTGCTLQAFKQNVARNSQPVQSQDNLFWLPYKRKVKYGNYEDVTFGKNYGKPLTNFQRSSYTEDFFDKDCLVSDIDNSNTITPENCANLHTHICSSHEYDYQICPANCVSAGIGSSKCYCKTTKESCQDYTQINSLFDINILLALSDKDECYVNSTSPTVQGYRQALYRNTWYYTEKQLNCSICSTRAILPVNESSNVEMVLTFDRNQRRLYLQVYSPEGLVKDGDEDYIYCFTDASSDLRKKVKVNTQYKYFAKHDNERTYYIYKVELEKYIGYYWCEAYKKSLSVDMVFSNKIVAFKEKKGNEYSLRMTIDHPCGNSSCRTNSYNDIIDDIVDDIFDEIDVEVRVMELFYFNASILDVLLHLSTDDGEYVVSEYHEVQELLKEVPSNIQVVFFKSSEFCMPETTMTGNKNLTWPLTRVKDGVVPEELCLQDNHFPVVRVCDGDFKYGAHWSPVMGTCSSENFISNSVDYLYSAVKQNISQTLLQNVTQVIENDTKLPVVAVYYLEKIFRAIYKGNVTESNIINSTIDMTNSLLKVEQETLTRAQDYLNSTDNILDFIDDILVNFKDESQVYLIQLENIIVHITNPYISNISGVILYSSPYTKHRIENFHRNDSFDRLVQDPELLLSVYVPEEILDDIRGQNLTNINIVTTIFFKDNLFVSNNSRKAAGPVVSVSIPGYGNYLPSSLPIIFKITNETLPECGFWDYGKHTQRKKGQWSTTGGNYLGNIDNETTIHSCTFNHLTHFALLILDENTSVQYLNNTDDHVLSVITCVGCSLSAIGISGIFITAILFEKWRKKPGTKILLNLSVAFLFEALAIYLTEINAFVQSDLSCQITGSIIHYVVLSKFLWMLVYAFLQYMRFVKVFGVLPENIVLKSALFAWSFGIIPVLIVNILTPSTYSIGEYRFCYPKGVSMYLGLTMPVVFIMVINLTVFGIVMYQVSKTKIESRHLNTDSYKLHLKLATLLFFVLGLPWTFGVLANLVPISSLRTLLVYLFCLMSTIQGFILFLFYVIFNPETRAYWTNYVFNVEKSVLTTSSKS